MKVKFVNSMVSFGYAYLAGETTELGSDLGNDLIANGDAILVSGVDAGLMASNIPAKLKYTNDKANIAAWKINYDHFTKGT